MRKVMTVAELIENLQQLDPDLEILIAAGFRKVEFIVDDGLGLHYIIYTKHPRK